MRQPINAIDQQPQHDQRGNAQRDQFVMPTVLLLRFQVVGAFQPGQALFIAQVERGHFMVTEHLVFDPAKRAFGLGAFGQVAVFTGITVLVVPVFFRVHHHALPLNYAGVTALAQPSHPEWPDRFSKPARFASRGTAVLRSAPDRLIR